ncbi:cytochrome c-type biogenesis protein [Congregibacter sp.]|uniref:cytochrome c-type biogenesis protein n=1 Tax=Congregibacter sp. TaxID=2744308 RepID=UPI003F6CB59F
MRLASFAFLLGVFCAVPAFAVIETYEFSSPQLEVRYRALSQELRCPKCQNQNIADSNAPISQDLRARVYEQLEEGASDEEILEDMVARYGEFVRYSPAASGAALWLWLAPALMLGVGFLLLLVLLRRGQNGGADDEDSLTAQERQRVAQMMSDKDNRQ